MLQGDARERVEHDPVPLPETGGGGGGVGGAPFLTVEELVARWFTVGSTANTDKTNRDNVRELISSGVLPGRKIGRRWYVHVRAVEAFEAGRDDPAVMRHPETRRLLGVAGGGGRS
ncbi:MAG: helix-turn-helix domain-containing protein [Pseudonocardiaceae bacterium]